MTDEENRKEDFKMAEHEKDSFSVAPAISLFFCFHFPAVHGVEEELVSEH